MSRITFFALLLIAAWVGWRMFKRERNRKRVSTRIHEAERATSNRATTLEKDPTTGVYRPVDRKD